MKKGFVCLPASNTYLETAVGSVVGGLRVKIGFMTEDAEESLFLALDWSLSRLLLLAALSIIESCE